MPNYNNERKFRFGALFIGFMCISLILFMLLSALIKPDGDEGMLLVVCIVISMQVSFLTCLVLTRRR